MENESGNGNGNSKITNRDLDTRLRAVEIELAEQHGTTKLMVLLLQISAGLNVGLITYLVTRVLNK